MKEIDRLHYHVRAIENDCAIVPIGSHKLTTKHEVHRNEAFRGITVNKAFTLDSYCHFRNVQDPKKRELLESDDAVFQVEIFDSLKDDNPNGSWSI
jgi:radial spoke head protein 9